MRSFVHFQALESEIISHEVLIEGVANAAQHMVNNKHFASADINARLEDLLFQLKNLKDLAAERRVKLADALKSQLVSIALVQRFSKFKISIFKIPRTYSSQGSVHKTRTQKGGRAL